MGKRDENGIGWEVGGGAEGGKWVVGGGEGGESPTPSWRRRLGVPGPGGGVLEQADLDGEAEQLGAALEAELVTQALTVLLDGLHAHVQTVGGFLFRGSLCRQRAPLVR